MIHFAMFVIAICIVATFCLWIKGGDNSGALMVVGLVAALAFTLAAASVP